MRANDVGRNSDVIPGQSAKRRREALRVDD